MNNYKLQFTEYFYFILQDVSGQVVLITGGGGGVGRHLALNFAELDARVVVWDINQAGKTIFENENGHFCASLLKYNAL